VTGIEPFVPWIPITEPTDAPVEGPLAGVRLAVKDVIDVAGSPTGAGHPRWLATHPPAVRDAEAVARLRAAGAAIVGKNHTDELAYSLSGTNAHYGTPCNPAAPGHTPGGSSSGTAAAVAAGKADLGLGTDTAGSIRVPASYTGLLGLRPTHTRVPRDGVVPLAPSFDVPGLLARDLPTLLAGAGCLLSGLAGGDAAARLLLPADLWAAVPAGVREALAPTIDRLAEALPTDRAPLFEAAAVDWDRARNAFSTVQAAEAWQAHGSWVRRERPTFGPDVTARLDMAAKVTNDEAADGRKTVSLTKSLLVGRLDRGGVLAIPSCPGPAPALEVDADRMAIVRFTCLASIAGAPAISIPAARLAGLPLGLSLIAAPGHDERLLDFVVATIGAGR
jgi:amidase